MALQRLLFEIEGGLGAPPPQPESQFSEPDPNRVKSILVWKCKTIILGSGEDRTRDSLSWTQKSDWIISVWVRTPLMLNIILSHPY